MDMVKRLAFLIFTGALLCSGSVAALDVMTQHEAEKMSDMVTVTVDRDGHIVAIDSSTTAFAAERERLARRMR